VTESQALAIALDPAMTPDAVRVTLYYASLGDGEHPYDFDRLSMLLEEAGEKRIRKALKRAVARKYLVRHHGGQHTDRFSFSPALNGGEKLSPPSGAGESAVSPPQAAGESAPPTTPPPTPPSPPVSPPQSDGLELVREYLGDEAVDAALASTVLPAAKLRALLGLFGPSGTQTDRIFRGISPTERRKALATAVIRYSLDATKYNNRLFETYLTRAINGDQNDGSKAKRDGTTGGTVRTASPSGGQAARGERGQIFNYE
jgi:hypothetical protein